MDQHTYVEKCEHFYLVNGLQPGNPDDGEWEDAHYPIPKCKHGTETRPFLHNHHQVQGLWQSEEFDTCCFFPGHAKEFLTSGPFVDDWFELWNIYDKWVERATSEAGKAAHEEKDELGRSKHAVAMAEKSHEEKDELGRSVNAVKAFGHIHDEKDELGRSLHNIKLHAEKDDLGRSVLAVKAFAHIHDEKDELGRSLHIMKIHEEKDELGRSAHAVKTSNCFRERWRCVFTDYESTASGVARHQRAHGILPLKERVPTG